jgi:hypothetical protein
MSSTTKYLESELAALRESNRRLQQYANTMQKKAQKYDKIVSRQERIRERYKFVIVFMKWLGPDSILFGSFVRRVFELAFHLDTLDTNNWMAEPLMSNIDIAFSEHNFSMQQVNTIHSFYQKIESLRVSVEIDGWCLDKKVSVGLVENNIPLMRLYFTREASTIVIDLYGWRPVNIIDFDLNGFKLSNSGLFSHYCNNNTDLFEWLEHIINKTVKITKPIEECQRQAFPSMGSVPRVEKSLFLESMYNTISIPLLKLLEAGYKLIGRHPLITIQREEDCSITGCKAPYPCVTLCCGHTISMMAYKGIITTPVPYTESVKCPMCRSDLIIAFVNTSENVRVFKPDTRATKIVPKTQYATVISQVSRDAFENL